ncbi:MAG: hypothetical protein JW863_04885 [Chitinispirillaceae bacterium]|nr:hypothetical protein [Chitinispirillaceae bacterium]
MRILEQGQVLPESCSTVVTVGNFDGVHQGHVLLMKETVRRAGAAGIRSVAITFEPHTREVLFPELVTERLTTFEEKASLIEQYGIDYLLRIPFTPEFSRKSPEVFIRSVLSDTLHAAEWVMGEGHGVGKDRTGGNNFLRSILSKYHIIPFTADLLKRDATVISSTQIRMHLVKGRVAEAVEMLGHPYLISAERIQGLKIGSQLGFPTLNFSRPPSQKVLPPPGVYAAELEYRNSVQPGALYFGDCPTFTGRTAHFEFHVFGNDKPFPETGESARLWLHTFIRPDRSFPTSGELITQIENDISTIQFFFRGERSCH